MKDPESLRVIVEQNIRVQIIESSLITKKFQFSPLPDRNPTHFEWISTIHVLEVLGFGDSNFVGDNRKFVPWGK